jgi:predicted pyridoxine 5'-phosphate oxidase superfamily flavin-nucleotide-binding protein
MMIGARPLPQDPVRQTLQPGAPVGILGIELTTRRRNRMNGRVSQVAEAGLTVDVLQSFGNCPKYIQTRAHRRVAPERAASRDDEGPVPGAEAIALISGADTFFIASTDGQDQEDSTHGVDVSHRGGKPGFVRVSQEGGRLVLMVPDFAGNGFFNTLGNLALDPRAGLLFVDFERGHLLQLAARGTILWDGAELDAFEGAERLLRLEITGAHWLRHAVDLRWEGGQPASQLPQTGDWTGLVPVV